MTEQPVNAIVAATAHARERMEFWGKEITKDEEMKGKKVVRPQGLEPRFSGSEPDVLPLHHGRIFTAFPKKRSVTVSRGSSPINMMRTQEKSPIPLGYDPA